jgi:hypothetical protein
MRLNSSRTRRRASGVKFRTVSSKIWKGVGGGGWGGGGGANGGGLKGKGVGEGVGGLCLFAKNTTEFAAALPQGVGGRLLARLPLLREGPNGSAFLSHSRTRALEPPPRPRSQEHTLTPRSPRRTGPAQTSDFRRRVPVVASHGLHGVLFDTRVCEARGTRLHCRSSRRRTSNRLRRNREAFSRYCRGSAPVASSPAGGPWQAESRATRLAWRCSTSLHRKGCRRSQRGGQAE